MLSATDSNFSITGITAEQTRSLAFAWRRQFGGLEASIWARKTARLAGRDSAFESLRAAAQEVNSLDSKLGQADAWDRACAGAAAAEAMLAVSVSDLATTEAERRYVDNLTAAWRHVFGDDALAAKP